MTLNGVTGIYYRELLVMRSRFFRSVVASSISPALFLFAFGYGIGRGSQIDGVSYIAFLIPGLITMASMNQCYGISTEINISRFYFRVFDEYLTAPIAKWEIAAGEMLYGVTKGFIPVAVIAVYTLLLGVDVRFTPLFLLVLILHMMIFSLLGLIVALIVKTHGDQFAVNTFVITPMVFLSGTFYPVEKMPAVVAWIVHLFPLTYSTRAIREAMLTGSADILALSVMVALTVLLFIGATVVVKRVEG